MVPDEHLGCLDLGLAWGMLFYNMMSIDILYNFQQLIPNRHFIHDLVVLASPHHRFPGRFGLENPCFVSCIGRNSSSNVAIVISEGLDTSIYTPFINPYNHRLPLKNG